MDKFQKLLKESLLEEGPTAKIDIDFDGDDKSAAKLAKKYKIKIKVTGNTTADLSGKKADLIKFLSSKDYDMDKEDQKDLFPELFKK